MKSIYFDGTKHYTIGKYKDGGYYKVEVDDIGNYKHGGSIHKYSNIADMNMDMSKMYEKGGIHIKPENRGKFTASANQHGMGVQEFAHKVMSNKDNYSPTMVKRANFAINSRKFKHQDGGELNMVKEVGPSWNHYNTFVSPMSQINYATGRTNQIYQPGIGVVKGNNYEPNFEEFTTNKPQYAITESLPDESLSKNEKLIQAEKLANYYEKQLSKNINNKDKSLIRDYTQKIKDVDSYIKDIIRSDVGKKGNEQNNSDGGVDISDPSQWKNGGLLKAQMGLTIPNKYKLAGAEVDFDPNQYYGETVPHDNRWNETLAERDYKIAMDPNFDNKNLPSNYGHLGKSMSNIMGKTSSMADAPSNISNITDFKSNPSTSNKSNPTNTGFNPYKLSTYGNRIAENALNRTTAFNLASSLLEPAYQNPLIVPDFKFKRQFVTPDYNPVYEMGNVGMRNISNNARSTAALMGNLQQLNANLVKAKSDISRQAQLGQLDKDAQFTAQEQAYVNQLAQAKQNVENLNKADLGEKRQYLSDTMTNWEKADQERSKLYNTELSNWNQINTYVNQLSPEYKAERNHKTGELSIVFKSTGKPVPNAELEKAKAQYQARLNSTNAVNNGNVNFTNPTLPINSTSNYTYTLPNRKMGGKLMEIKTKTPNKIKKLRTGLY